MKNILFITKSCLAQNLMGLILQTIPKKTEYRVESDLNALKNHNWRKPLQLLLIDVNVFQDFSCENIISIFQHKNFKNALKILIHPHSKDLPLSDEELRALGIQQLLAKPFLPEELVSLIVQSLGSKS